MLLGIGDGTFWPAIAYDSGAYGSDSVVVGDVNGDGKPDLLVANECEGAGYTGICASGTVAVLLGNGDGTFGAALTYVSGGSGALSLALGDVNGDGKPDLVVGGRVAVLLGNGDGTFQAVVAYSSGGAKAYSVATADVNGDGKLDLVVANSCVTIGNCASGGVGVLLGNGDGTLRPAVTYSSGGYQATSVAIADVNGDGKPDLVVGNQCADSNCDGAVGVLLGNGDGTFRPTGSYSSGGYYPLSVAVADVNGDGKLDLVVANYCITSSNCANGTVGVLLGNGDGTFQAAVTYGSGGKNAVSVAVADVNGDGKPDLLVANSCDESSNCANGTVGVLLGNGDGTFQAAVPTMTPHTNSGALALADFNGDGKLDVASGAGNYLLLGNGDGTFQSPLFSRCWRPRHCGRRFQRRRQARPGSRRGCNLT